MSRLDSFIRRMSAQRDGLNWAASEIAELRGGVLELGLGNGRTFDHIRELFSERLIAVVERDPNPSALSTPTQEQLWQGEAEPMLAAIAAKHPNAMALAHYDLGFGDKAKDVAEAARLSPLIAACMAPGGVLVSAQPLLGFTELPRPGDIAEGRYYFYRAT